MTAALRADDESIARMVQRGVVVIPTLCKAGSVPIKGVLDYCQRPTRPVLFFMDAWMSSYSLIASFAAAGCQMAFYQLGARNCLR